MRRKTGVVAAGVAVALVAGAGGAVALLRGPDTSPVPATKRALAAVTVDVLDIRPTSYDVNPRWDVPEALGVEIRFKPDGGGDSDYLHVAVDESGTRDLAGCNEYYDCAQWDGAEGTYYLSWQEEQPEEDPGILTLALDTGTEQRSVTYAGEAITGDPRDQELPLDVESDLARLVSDDRFSATTTQEMVDTDLAKWPDDEDAGDPAPTTPTVLAGWLEEDGLAEPDEAGPVDASSYGDAAVGVELRSRDRTVTVVLVPKAGGRVPACGSEWSCRKRRGVTTGWREGEVLVLRPTGDAVLVATVRAESLTAYPRPPWRFGDAGRDVEALQRGWCACNLVTTRAYAQGAGPSWFSED